MNHRKNAQFGVKEGSSGEVTEMPMNILIVENSFAVASVLMELIERWGHNVEKVTSDKGALKRFTQNMFDLVLLDIFPPDMEGCEPISQLKNLNPETDIVAMTGYNSRELEIQVRKEGVLYYMIKLFEMKELQSLLDHISQKRAQQKN